MPSEKEQAIARRISRRWYPDGKFSSDDAYQTMMLALLESKVPESQPGLRVKIMKDAAVRQSIETGYLMRMPLTSWRRMGGAPSHVKYTGLTTDVADSTDSVPDKALASDEDGFQRVEDRAALAEMLGRLNPTEKARLLKWAARPSSVTGQSLWAVNRTVKNLRDRAQR